MFRLLTILLAIYFSSPGDGVPVTVAVEPGQNNYGNRQDLILEEGNAGSKGALALNDENLRLPAADGGTEPSLKTRALSQANKLLTLKETITKRTNSGTSAASSKASRRNRTKTIRYPRADSSLDWTAEIETSQKKKDAAKALVNALRRILPKRDSIFERSKSMVNKIRMCLANQQNDPNEDEILAELMDKAIVMYDSAYGRDWRGLDDLAVDDKEGRVRRLVEEMYDIFDDLDTSDEIIPELTPEICEYWRKFNRTSPSQRQKDHADAFVRQVRRDLGNKRFNEKWNFDYPALMEAAITQYNNAYGRDRPSVADRGTMDEEAYMKLLTEEMNNVFDHYDTHAKPVTLGPI